MAAADTPWPPGPGPADSAPPRTRRKLARSGPRPMALEQRQMFDGAAVHTAIDDLTASIDRARADALPLTGQRQPEERAVASTAATGRLAVTGTGTRELVFIDPAVANAAQWQVRLREGVELVVLDASGDPWAQMGAAVSQHHELQAVHLLAHGAPGQFLLTGTHGLADALGSVTADAALASWAAHLAADADILIYGCSSGAGDGGRQLVERIARLTQADVAASTDATGSDALGGNWVLEYRSGPVETVAGFAAAWLALEAPLLGVPTVSTTMAALELIEPSTLNAEGASIATLSGWTIDNDGDAAAGLSLDVTLSDPALATLADPGGITAGVVTRLPDGLRFSGSAEAAQAWLNQLRLDATDVERGNTAASGWLSVRVSDAQNPALAGTTTLKLTVTPSNDPVRVDNAQVRVTEGAPSTVIGAGALRAIDPEVTAGSQSPSQVVYRLGSVPLHGYVTLAGERIGLNSTFTHEQVIAGSLAYAHTAGGGADQNTADRFELLVNDGATPLAQSDTAVVSIAITPVNQAPVVRGSATFYEGQPYTALSSGLPQSVIGLSIAANGGGDPGDDTLDLRITRLPQHGWLHFKGTARIDGLATAVDRALSLVDLEGAGFVIAYADRDGLRYQHDGIDRDAAARNDSFDVTVTDGGGGTANRQSTSATVVIDVRPVNDDPVFDPASTRAAVVTVNGPNRVLDGGGDDYRVTLDTSMLRVNDVDSGAASLAFVITRLPQDGSLLLDNAALGPGASFTMADLAAGRVQYVQTAVNSGGANAVDDFEFQVRDGAMSLRWDSTGEDYTRAGGAYTGPNQADTLRTLVFNVSLAETSAGDGGSGSTGATPVPASTLQTRYVGLPPSGPAVSSLVEGGSVTITSGVLSYASGSLTPDQIVYTVAGFSGAASGLNGNLRKDGVALGILDSFTQADVNAGRLRFVHDGSEVFASSISFYVSATGASGVAQATLDIHAAPVNDAPTALGVPGTTLPEGGTVAITTERLRLADVDDTTSESYLENDPAVADNHRVNEALDNGAFGADPLRWRVVALPAAGRLQVDTLGTGQWVDVSTADVASQTLYAADLLQSGRVRYVHDGLETRNDSFQVVARDRWGSESASATVALAMTNVNDAPEVAARPTRADPVTTGRAPNLAGGPAANEPLTVIQEGSVTRLTATMLQAWDPDSTAQQVQYRITSAPAAGRLAFCANGSAFTTIGLGSSFSQQQVQDGQIYYLHDGAEPTGSAYPGTPDDRFIFTLADGNQEQTGNEFWIYVQPTNDAPTVSGAAGPVDIDSAIPALNPVAGFSVNDLDLTNGVQAGERDFLQVTVRLQSAAGVAPASYATGFGGGGVRIGFATPSDTGGDWAVLRGGVNDALQIQGSRIQVNEALAGLNVTFEHDLDASWTLQVIADDRLRGLGGGLLNTGPDANGGEWNQPGANTGAPTAVPTAAFDWTAGVPVPAGHPNIGTASVVLRASSINDAATLSGPALVSVTEDVRSRVTGVFTVADAESAAFDLPVSVALTVGSGTLDFGPPGAQTTLTPSGGRAVALGGDGSSRVTLTGRASDIQALLNGRNATHTADDASGGVHYTGAADLNHDLNGADPGDVTLTLTMDDAGARIGSDIGAGSVALQPAPWRVGLDIVAVNDAPAVTAPTTTVTAIDTAVAPLRGFVLTDVDAADGRASGESTGPMQVLVRLLDAAGRPLPASFYAGADLRLSSSAAAHGAIVDATLHGTGRALALRGTLAQLQAFLDGLELRVGRPDGVNFAPAYRVEVVVDDRLRDAAGVLTGSADGGVANQPGLQPVPLSDGLDPYASTTAAFGVYNVAAHSRPLTIVPYNDPGRITAAPVRVAEGSTTLRLDATQGALAIDDPDDHGAATLSATVTLSAGTIVALGGIGGDVSGLGSPSLTVSGATEVELNQRLRALTLAWPDPEGAADAADFNGVLTVTVTYRDAGNTGARLPSLPAEAYSLDADPGAARHVDDSGSALETTRRFTITVEPVNDAPTRVGTGAVTLPALTEDSSPDALPGARVDALFGESFADPRDAVAGGSGTHTLAGVAITGNLSSPAQGRWQWSSEGSAWTDLPAVATSNALLLATSDRLRFVPAADFQGTPGSLSLRAVDSSGGAVTTGARADLSDDLTRSGGSTRYADSGQALTLATTVLGANDRPTARAATLAATVEDEAAPPGARVAELDFGFDDGRDDRSAMPGGANTASAWGGLAIVGNAADAQGQGVWQYAAADGWVTIGSGAEAPADANAILLPLDARVRFLPSAVDFNGQPGALTVRIADSPVSFGAAVDLRHAVSAQGTWSAPVELGSAVQARNDAPVLTGRAASPVAAENAQTETGVSVPPVRLLTGARIADVDLASTPGLSALVFGAGRLTVGLSDGRAGDVLQVGIPLPAGVIASGGSGATPLVLNLDADTTLAEVDALLAALEFAHTGEDPGGRGSQLTRQYTVTVDDGNNVQPSGSAGGPAGRAAAVLQGVVTLVPANDAPALDLDPASPGSGATLRWTEAAGAPHAPVPVAAQATLSDPDNTLHSALRLRIEGLRDGNAERLLAGAVSLPLAADASIDAGEFRLLYDSTSATLTVLPRQGGTAGTAAFQAWLRELRYVNDSDRPAAGTRQIVATLTDAGLDESGPIAGAATSAAARTTIEVVPANDPATLVLAARRAFGENALNAGGLLLDGALSMLDPDSDDFGGGSLHISGLVAGQDRIGLPGSADGAGSPVRLQGNSVEVRAGEGWRAVGRLSGGDGRDLVIDFTAAAQRADVEQVLRQLRLHNSADDPVTSRTLTWTLDDGDGGTPRGATMEIVIAAENDPPALTPSEGDRDAATLDEGHAGLATSGTLTVVDPDAADTVSVVVAGVDIQGPSGVVLPTTSQALAMLSLSGQTANAADPGTGARIGWSFDTGGRAFDDLGTGQSLVLRYTLRATDSSAAAAAATRALTVTIRGSNDAPLLSAASPGDTRAAVTEDATAGAPAALRAGGLLSHADVDSGDYSRATVQHVGATGLGGAVVDASLNQGLENAVTLTGPGATTAARGGMLQWAFTLDDALTQGLGAGESVLARYRVAVTDDSGAANAQATQDIEVRIDGANDRPVIFATDVSGAVAEGSGGATLRDAGSLSFTDADMHDLARVSAALQGVTRSSGLALDAGMRAALESALNLAGDGVGAAARAGTVTWTFALADALVNNLAAGETLTATWGVRVSDDSGATDASASQDVAVTITGSNDAPSVVAIDAEGSVVEDVTSGTPARLRDSGTLAFTDADAGDKVRARAQLQTLSPRGGAVLDAALREALAGALVLSGDGVAAGAAAGTVRWDFTLDNDLAQTLATGQSIEAVWRVSLQDTGGGETAQDVRVLIAGANDAPTLQIAAPPSWVEAADARAQTLTQTGGIGVGDVDASDSVTLAWTYAGDIAWTGGTLTASQVTALTQGVFGIEAAPSSLAGAARWHYLAEGVDLDFLGAGERITLSYDIQARDSAAATSTERVRLVIEGRNDAPLVTAADLLGDVDAAGAGGVPPLLRDVGSLSFRDADANDVARASVRHVGVSGEGGARVDAALVQALGQALTLTGAGVGSGAASGSVNWTFALDPALVRHLGAGQSLIATWRIELGDSSATSDAITARDVVITLRGANDAPTISADTPTAFVEAQDARAQTLAQSGAVRLDDADDGQELQLRVAYNGDLAWSRAGGVLDTARVAALTQSVLQLSAVSALAPGSVRWDYLASGLDLDFLAADETLRFSFTVTATDAAGASASQRLAFSVVGTAETPALEDADLSGAVTEDRTSGIPPALRDAGTVGFSGMDPTAPSRATATFLGAAANGGAAVAASLATALPSALQVGTAVVDPVTRVGLIPWSFVLDNALVQGLRASEAVQARWRIALADDPSATQDVTVTVQGANDPPTVGAAPAGVSVGEDAPAGASRLVADGTLGFADPDRDERVQVRASLQGVAGSGGVVVSAALADALTGALTLSGPGTETAAAEGLVNWRFELDPALVQFLSAGQSLTATWRLQFSDDSGTANAATFRDVAVTITGANDALALTPVDITGTMSEDGASGTPSRLRDSGTIAFTDPDAGDRVRASVTLHEIRRAGEAAADAALDAALAQALRLSGAGTGEGTNTGILAWHFELDPALAQSLAAGQSVSATWRVSFGDGSGLPEGTRTQDITVTIEGAPDAPAIGSADTSGGVTEDITSGSPARLRDSGTIEFSAVDATQRVRAQVSLLGSSAAGGAGVSAELAQALPAALTLSGDGIGEAVAAGQLRWDFALDNSLAQYLDAGQAVFTTWRIVFAGETGTAGSTAARDVTVTLRGANDAPAITVIDATGEVREDLVSGTPAWLRDRGSLAFADPDSGDRVYIAPPKSIRFLGVGGVNLESVAGQALKNALAGALTLSGAGTGSTPAAAAGSVEWTFALDNTLTQFMGPGQSVSTTWRIGFSDEPSSLEPASVQDVVVTVHGTNDAPQVTPLKVTARIGEDDGTGTPARLVEKGSVTFADVDAGQSVRASVGLVDANGSGGAAVSPALRAALAGALELSGPAASTAARAGTLAWTFGLDASLVQALAPGQGLQATWRVSFTDDSGDADATTTQDIVITIDGANDAPVLTLVDVAGSVTEDLTAPGSDQLRDRGSLRYADDDAGSRIRASASFVGAQPGGGAVIGDALRQALADALRLSGDGAAAGTLTWDFALDNTLVQPLGQGQSVIATWRLAVSDGAGNGTATQDIVVTIHGTNDAVQARPGDAAGSVAQGQVDPASGRLRDQGALAYADGDSGDRVRVEAFGLASVQATPGIDLDSTAGRALRAALVAALELGTPADGTLPWTFALDDRFTRFLGTRDVVTATWRVGLGDGSGDSAAIAHQDVVVTISGANDTPEVQTARPAVSLSEDSMTDAQGRLVETGSIGFSDADAGDLVRASVGAPAISRASGTPEDAALDAALAQALTLSGAGTGAAAPSGSLDWRFALDATLAQALSDGQSVSATWRIAFADDSGRPGSTRFQDLTVTLNGANDAPVITTPAPTGRVVEDSGGAALLRDGGNVGFADADAGQRVRARVELLGVQGGGMAGAAGAALRAALDQALSLSGAGVTHAVDAGTLRWDFALDNALAQHLGQDQTVVATWRLSLSDDSGSARSTTTRDLAITIVGANDAPIAVNDAFIPALGKVVEGALVAGSDSDVDGDPLRVASVNGTPFEALAGSTTLDRPAQAGWREVDLGHGTLFLQADGQSAYAHAGRAFVVAPLPGSGTLELRQADGSWQTLAAPTRVTLQALQAGALRYLPGPQEIGQPMATVAEATEIDWRSDGFTYTVTDGRTGSQSALVRYTVGAGADQFGVALASGPDADIDGIPNRTEGLLASRVSGEPQGLQTRAYTLLPAQLEAGSTGPALLLRLQAGLAGDLNADGKPDAAQSAVVTFAWTGHAAFARANTDPSTLDGMQSIVTLVAEASRAGSGQALESVQVGDVQVRALSEAQATDFETRFRFGPAWSPLSFTASLGADTAAVDVDVDPAREGVQWRFTIDISRSGESERSYLGFVKWVDASTIERYRGAGMPLHDLDGRTIDQPGWIDFTRRAPDGDGALLVRTADGRLLLDIVITDNRFGDSDTTAGRLADPVLPVFVNERDDRRPLSVTSPQINEASPWSCFEIRGAAGQIVTLSLADGNARGAGIDYGSSIEVSADGGRTWSQASQGTELRLPQSGVLLARTALVDDTLNEGAETFRLVVRTTGGLVAEGVATLRDDGTGVVFRNDGSVDAAGRTTDDRPPVSTLASSRMAGAVDVTRSSGASPPWPEAAAAMGTAPSPFNSALMVLRSSTLGLPERATWADGFTSGAGFQAVVVDATRAGLSLYRPIADQFFPSNRTVTFTIPADTFAHTSAEAVLRLEARLADGRTLPAWIVFDARTGTFRVTPPAGYAGDLDIRVTARDQAGREAAAAFKVKVTSAVMVNPGRPGLSEQLGAAGASGLRPLGSGTLAPAEPASASRSTSVGAETASRQSLRAPLSDRTAADAVAAKRVRR